jgi:hopanoid biosynthesis associated protein HpnK
LRQLIVTADDFGLSVPVNEAIEQAYREGVLTAASLMVGAPCAEDAVRRARRNPDLRIGLHLAVTRARPVLPASALPDITDGNGDLPYHLARAGVRFFFLPRARRQLEAEIRAQFQAFRATGLELDHVDGHNHMHLHPTVFGLILRIGADYGLPAVRLPREPLRPFLAGGQEALPRRVLQRLFLAPWVGLLAMRLRRAGVSCNDFLFGLFDTGSMHRERVLALLPHLPEGVSEMFFHPAADGPGARPLADPDACRAELDTLLSNEVRARLAALAIAPRSFGGTSRGGGIAPGQRVPSAAD